MKQYYLVSDGYLVGKGACQEGLEDSIFNPGAELHWGEPPDTLQNAPADKTLAALTQRSGLLKASDWTQLPDVPLSTKTSWAAYRQSLRDITDQPGFPNDVIWPIQPVG